MLIKLRTYQEEGIKTIKSHKNFGIFWQQRLGKTIVAIKGVEDYKKVIFVVPNNTILHWYVEIMNNLNDKNVKIVPKVKTQRIKFYKEFNQSDQMWAIISYDIVARDFFKEEWLNPFEYIVLDESHFLRNTKSRRTKSLLKLRLKSQYALALSGTPAVNNAIDILKIFKFIYPDQKFGHKYIFKKKYFDVIKNSNSQKPQWIIKKDKLDEWNQMLSSLCDIKKVRDYLKWLPETIYKSIRLEMKDNQREHYNRMLIESKRIIKESREKKENMTITQIIRLQQICLCPKLLGINAASVKLEWLESYLEELLEDDDKNEERIIVFTNFSSIYKVYDFKITKKYKVGYLTGSQTETEKANTVRDFQNRKIKILFSNIKVGSLGLTLDEATCTIFLDKSWNPIDNEQASFRMVDTKQKNINRPKLIIDTVCINSIDDKINDVLSNKKTQTSIIYEIEKYILNEKI